MWCVTPIRSFPVKHILNTRHLWWEIIAACRQVTSGLGPSDCAFHFKKTKKQGDSLELKVSRPGVDVSARHPRSQKPFDPLCAVLFLLFRLMFVISCSCSSAPRFPLLRNKCTNVLVFCYVLFLFLGGGLGVKGSTGMRVVYLVQSDVSHVQYI